METGRPVAKTLIKYNSNNLEENEEERESIDIEFTERKPDLYNDENAIDIKWLNVQEKYEEEIALVNFIEGLQKQIDNEFFSKM